ncbi:hypothetical protein FACS1894211_01940 [Clostridia bacterium]|nr:hypothetical protein FACS1894211_01940 [Clostridia bacterium]
MVLTGLLTVIPLTACGEKNGLSDIKAPVYAKGRQFEIGAFVSPFPTKTDYQTAADMGLTKMWIFPSQENHPQRTSPEYNQILEWCGEIGMKAIVQIGARGTVYPNEPDYTKMPGVGGICWWDEPRADDIPDVAKLAKKHMELYGDKLPFMINHLPNWVEKEQKSLLGDLNSWGELLETYYKEVLTKITSGPRVLSYDVYPLMLKNGGRFVRADWVPGIATFANIAQKYDLYKHVFIQATDHGGIYDVGTEESLRFQFNTYLAFGFNDFSYFTYAWPDSDPDFTNSTALVDRVGEPTYLYYAAQKINKELKSFEHVYLNFEWVGAMPVKGTINKNPASTAGNMDFDGIGSIPFIKDYTATEHVIFGQFVDKDGRDGLQVTNFTQPYDGLYNTVKIEFTKAKKVLVYTKGTEKVHIIENNTFEFELEPGQGAFMIPLG